MTQIQNSKQIIRQPARLTASWLAEQGLRSNAIRRWWMIWLLIIEIWDLFVIWCLEFEILLSYKSF